MFAKLCSIKFKSITGLSKYIFSKVDFPYLIYTFMLNCKIRIPLILGRGKTYTDSLCRLGGCLCGRGSDDRHPLLQHLRSHLPDILGHRFFNSSLGYNFRVQVFFPKEFSDLCIEGTMSVMVVFTQDFTLFADQSADFQYFVMKTPSFFIYFHRRNILFKIPIFGFV